MAFSFTKEFEIEGMDKLQAELDKLRRIIPEKQKIGLSQAGHLLAGYCRVECPVDTGRLRASIGNPSQEGGIFREFPQYIIFGTSVYYASWVHDGTSPHTILPKNKKVLAWPSGPVATKIGFTNFGTARRGALYRTGSGELTGNKKNQKYFFAKKVSHPGTKANPFMLRGISAGIPATVDFLAKFYEEAIR